MSCGFFLFERSWAGELFKILTNVNTLIVVLYEIHLNWHIIKLYILSQNMPIKSLKKINLGNNTKGILLLDFTN